MTTAYAALTISAYLVLFLLAPFYNPHTLTSGLRLLFLMNSAPLLIGVFGFLITFTRPSIPTSQEETHG